jgi:fucose permease
MCILAVPYGLGAGAVDAALNNYVALHLAARHMSWLHMCWGIGASISPFIMSACLADQGNWRGGYLSVSAIQFVLAVILIATLPVWKKHAAVSAADQVTAAPIGIRGALKIKGVPYMLTAFFGYCAMEAVCFMWASSYLVEYRHIDSQTAAMFASLAYLGLTSGRFLNGFVAEKLGDRRLIRIGSAVITFGIVLIVLPLPGDFAALAGILITGFGCAPIYPCIIHSTPANFGRENSQAIVGIQMASAYTGSTFMPPIFGLLGEHFSMGLYPYFMLVFTVLMVIMSEKLNRIVKI